MDRFQQTKDNILKQLQDSFDKSPKGSIDAPICKFIHQINQHDDYVRHHNNMQIA